MAKIVVAGNAVVIKSEVTLEDLKMVRKLRPSALVLNDNEGEPVFAVSITEGNGNLNKNGISFSSSTNDVDGLATATLCDVIADEEDAVFEIVADKVGKQIACLDAIEKELVVAIPEIADERAKLIASIELA